MTIPQIYVICVASYYQEGIVHGTWINANQNVNQIKEEIQMMLTQSTIEHAEGYVIYDYQGFGELILHEYEKLERVTQYAQFIVKYGELAHTLIADYGFEHAKLLMEKHYYDCYESPADFAYEVMKDSYSNQIPKHLMPYFDYKAFAEKLLWQNDDFFALVVEGETHVFIQ